MKKTKAIYMQYLVTIPALVSYDTDDEPEDGVAYMVLSESENDRFAKENIEHAIDLLTSLPDVVEAQYQDPYYGDHGEYDLDYIPEVPMWTEYMPRYLLVEQRSRQLKDDLECALDNDSYDDAIRIIGELRKLAE